MADPIVPRAWLTALLLLGACASGAPRRVECEQLPRDAFDRCRRVLAMQWGTLEVVDPAGFRIQTAWNAHVQDDQVGQKRATIFLDGQGAVVVVAEVRWLEGGVITTPRFGEPQGDDDLTLLVRDALAGALVQG